MANKINPFICMASRSDREILPTAMSSWKDKSYINLAVRKSAYPELFTRMSINTPELLVIDCFALKAIYEYAAAKAGKTDATIGLVLTIDGSNSNSATQLSAELCEPSTGKKYLWSLPSTGNAQGGVITPLGSDKVRVDSIPATNSKEYERIDLSPVFAMLLYYLTTDNAGMVSPEFYDIQVEAQSHLTTITNAISTGSDLINVKNSFFWLAIAMYDALSINVLKVKVTEGNHSIGRITLAKVESGALSGKIIFGKAPTLVDFGEKASKNRSYTAKEARELFADFAKLQHWSAEEEALIPTFADDYPVLPETIKIAKRYVNSRDAKRPMVNALWRGTTAYGKSTGVKMLANILHIPYVKITCHVNMEAQEFLSTFVPDNSENEGILNLPKFGAICCDPEGVYKSLTGKEKPDVSCDEVLLLLYKRAAKYGAGQGSARFKLIESEYVRGLSKGYIVEVQEMSRIRDSGTMVALNEYDRAGAIIPLVNGDYTTRHSNALVIYTDNVGYASCRPVDPSVMRRMDFVLDSFTLSDEQIRKRIEFNTGFTDVKKFNVLMNVRKKIIEYCHQHDITDGELSVNELERWISLIMMEGTDIGTVETSCTESVIAKASSDRETQAEIEKFAFGFLKKEFI